MAKIYPCMRAARRFLPTLMNINQLQWNFLVKYILCHHGPWVSYQTAETQLSTLPRFGDVISFWNFVYNHTMHQLVYCMSTFFTSVACCQKDFEEKKLWGFFLFLFLFFSYGLVTANGIYISLLRYKTYMGLFISRRCRYDSYEGKAFILYYLLRAGICLSCFYFEERVSAPPWLLLHPVSIPWFLQLVILIA